MKKEKEKNNETIDMYVRIVNILVTVASNSLFFKFLGKSIFSA